MRRKHLVTSALLMIAMCLCACGDDGPDYSAWIPDHTVSEIIRKEEEKPKFEYRGEIDKSLYTDEAELTEMILSGSPKAPEAVYTNQLINGAYEDLSDVIAEKRTVIYVSSSEGDDTNNGLSPERPKKTLSLLSEFNTVAILLKSGDTFEMDDMFYVGTETVIGCYGEGPRPVLDFTKPLEGEFVKLRAENMWAMDLSKSEFVSDKEAKENINFGQLYIDGECNWKRLVVAPEQCAEYPFAEVLSNSADGAWAADWVHGFLYLYSEEDPNTKEIRVATRRHGLNIRIANNVYLSDLEIKGVGANGIQLQECTNVHISNCYIHEIGGSVQTGIGNRYGNAIQLIGTNNDVFFTHNYVDNIYDCGVSSQGLSVTDRQCNIIITDNVFTKCYTGIEQFSDEKCIMGCTNFNIDSNIFYDMSDVTGPSVPMYVDAKGVAIDKSAAYKSYHYDSEYAYITCANLTNFVTPGELKFTNNICWGTDRFLMRFDINNEYPVLTGNVFYEDVDSDKICLFDTRSLNKAGIIANTYVRTLGQTENTELINVYKFGKGEEKAYTVSDEAKVLFVEYVKRVMY